MHDLTLKILKIKILIMKHGCDFVTLIVDKESPIICFPGIQFEVIKEE